MRKCFLLLAFIAVCCTSCSKDIAEIGQICPPRGVHNATTYVFRGTETILWSEVRCPEEAPLCIQFSMDEVIRDTFYCHPDCEVGTKPCYGACIPVADVCITQETESKCKNGERPNGTCICPDECPNGCDIYGECLDIESKCANGERSDGTCICPDDCPDGCDPFGKCLETVLPQDKNHNHMDDRYETAINQGEDCRVYADCDTAAGANDGFCDSFIGYQCSTRCTSDDQCIDDGEYHYVCRGDGRCAPDEFVTVWKIPDNNTDLVLPNYKDKCAFEVDWGDSMNESVMCSHSDTVIRHTYKTGGTYTVRIKGTYDGYGDSYVCVLSGCDDPPESASKLIEVKSFGPVGLERAAFAMCENLVSLSNVDIPDSTKLRDMAQMFSGTSQLNVPLEHWDVSNVTDMSYLFCPFYNTEKSVFNQPLNRWDVSKVTEMEGTFMMLESFDQPLDKWDVSNVTNMHDMFSFSPSFNQPLNSWNVSKVADMGSMFKQMDKFNQPLDKWDVSNVVEMERMFANSVSFNQPLDMWHVSRYTDVPSMFVGSGISKENYCAIVLSDTWMCSKDDFRMNYTCD